MLRELNVSEPAFVGGGLSLVPLRPGDTVTFYDNDRNGILSSGDSIIEYTTSEGTDYTPEAYSELVAAEAARQGQDFAYWEVGYSLGIGFGLYGTGDGMGISWNAGVGVYGEVGSADTAEEAASQVGEDQVVIGVEEPSVPTSITIDESGDVDLQPSSFGGGVGVYATDSDPMSPYEQSL